MIRNKLFRDLKDIQKDMLRILGEVTTLTSDPMSMDENDDIWQPRCDVFGSKEELVVIVDLAGVAKESIHISSGDKFIKISGERIIDIDCDNVCYYNMEIESGHFERKIYFPDTMVDIAEPKVTYSDGFLKIIFNVKYVEEKVINVTIE